MLKRSLAALATLAALSPLAACGDQADEADQASDPTEATSSAPASGTCEYAEDGQPPAKEVELPPAEPAESGQVPVTVRTSAGEIAMTLDADSAPCTVSSFVSLAEQGYYDGSECHRIAMAQGFAMLQCGDPTATGTGGPGYTVPDELSGSETYPAGTIAMANTGQPDSGGGQFFLVFGDTQLPPSYTVFGTFDEKSIELLQGVGAKGHDDRYGDGTGFPKERVVFEEITVG